MDYSSEIMYGGEKAVQHTLIDVTEHRKYEERLEALHRNALELIEAETLDNVAELTLNAIERTLGFNRCGFGLVEDKMLQFSHVRGVEGVINLPLSGKGITVRAVNTGETQFVPDIRLDDDYVLGSVNWDYEALSEIAVPVKVGGEIVAVLNVESAKLDAYTTEDEKLIKILAEHVASAISRIEQLKVIRASGETYRRLLDSSFDGMILLSGTKIIYANSSEAKLLGYDSASELIGLDITIPLPEDEKELVRQRTLRRQRGDSQPDRYELRLLRKDGGIVETETATTMIEYEGKPAVLSVTRDISDRKRYQTRLVQLHGSGKRFAGASTRDEIWDAAIETVSHILGFDFVGIGVIEANTVKFVRSVGAELPKDWSLGLSKPGIISRAIELGVPQLVRDTSLDPDYFCGPGFERRSSELAIPIIVDGHPVAVLNIEGDRPSMFTEADVNLIQILVGQVSSALDRLTHFEEEIRRRETSQRERLEGIERMSGMVRHDLRGPLQTIQSASYMLRRRPERVEELTRRIDEGVDYAVRILEDLRVMTKPGALNRVSTDLGELIEKSIDGAVIPATVSVVRDLASIGLEVDQYRIRRVVDNLIRNAVEAMPDGGTLTLRVEAADGSALLTVRDTGRGISDEVARNLFTPFYTTKPTGTGLGLAICRQVVEAHGGRITFESKVREGTMFTVALPLSACALHGSEDAGGFLEEPTRLEKVRHTARADLSLNDFPQP